jgi:hypothetical protein
MDWWIRQRCATMAQSINTGLAKADGDIIAIFESGHLYLPGTLDHVAKIMTSDTPWLVGNAQRIDENDNRLGLCQASCPASLASLLKHDSGVLPLPSSFFSRAVLTQVGRFDEHLRVAYDYEFHCRLLALGYRPRIENRVLAARREKYHDLDAQGTLTLGHEYVQVALEHAADLEPADRKALLLNCDHRHRIYALAEAELQQAVAPSQAVRAVLEHHPMPLGAVEHYLDHHHALTANTTSTRRAV